MYIIDLGVGIEKKNPAQFLKLIIEFQGIAYPTEPIGTTNEMVRNEGQFCSQMHFVTQTN